MRLSSACKKLSLLYLSLWFSTPYLLATKGFYEKVYKLDKVDALTCVVDIPRKLIIRPAKEGKNPSLTVKAAQEDKKNLDKILKVSEKTGTLSIALLCNTVSIDFFGETYYLKGSHGRMRMLQHKPTFILTTPNPLQSIMLHHNVHACVNTEVYKNMQDAPVVNVQLAHHATLVIKGALHIPQMHIDARHGASIIVGEVNSEKFDIDIHHRSKVSITKLLAKQCKISPTHGSTFITEAIQSPYLSCSIHHRSLLTIAKLLGDKVRGELTHGSDLSISEGDVSQMNITQRRSKIHTNALTIGHLSCKF